MEHGTWLHGSAHGHGVFIIHKKKPNVNLFVFVY